MNSFLILFSVLLSGNAIQVSEDLSSEKVSELVRAYTANDRDRVAILLEGFGPADVQTLIGSLKTIEHDDDALVVIIEALGKIGGAADHLQLRHSPRHPHPQRQVDLAGRVIN